MMTGATTRGFPGGWRAAVLEVVEVVEVTLEVTLDQEGSRPRSVCSGVTGVSRTPPAWWSAE